MANDATTGTVVVALPAADDPVNAIGEEQKHATLVFLGDDVDQADVDAVHVAVAAYVAAGLKDGTLGPFPEKVTGVESLGDKGARVWMINSDDGLATIHDDLAALPAIADLMAATEQFPSYTPHVTVGYPPDGATGLDEATEAAAAGVESISFDRIALWSGTTQIEIPLTDGGSQMTEARRPPVHETGVLSERATARSDGRWPVQIITAGLGSSGYYSPDVLERAAENRLVEAGTPMFFDHPSESERTDRPERSVRDIGGVFTGAATYDATGQRLVGEVQVFKPYRELVAEMAPHIGVSISGSATDITEGMVDGRRVPVVEDLFAISSVDMVTKAGRGGQFMSLLESARAEVDRQADAAGAGVEEATYSDKQSALCDAVKAKYGADKTYAWVRDFDDETVWFEISGSKAEALYGQGYTFDATSGEASLTGSRTEVRAVTSFVPVGTSSASESAPKEDAMSETAQTNGAPTAENADPPTQTTTPATEAAAEETATGAPAADTTHTPSPTQEAHMTDTTTGAGGTAPAAQETAPVPATPPRNPREVMEAQLREQGRQIALLRAENRARDIVAEVLASGWIGDAQRARLASTLVTDPPLTEAGDLDEQALRDRAQRGLDEAETEAAEILSAAGVGTPRGLGALTTPATEATGKQYEDTLRESFIQRGMSETAADLAVKGR
jgi:2'-5' RNA ligase